MIQVSGVVITYNEERNIEECITSMKPVVDEVLVVDSFSSDKTKEVCERLKVRFIANKFEGHIQQKNFAMSQAKYDYILSLDADERLSDGMKKAILEKKENWSADGYSFNRLNNYCGAWLKHCWYPDKKTRLWDRNKGKWGGENPHDRVLVNGKIEKLSVDILHYAYHTVDEHFNQIQKFALIAAEAKHEKGRNVNFLIDIVIGPWFRFLKKYILKLGFLDGYYGFIFCVMSGYLNFMKYSKLWELNRKGK